MVVTKQTLTQMIDSAAAVRKAHLIGRACVALFRMQTDSEKADNTTQITNMQGFTGADARSGSLTAKYYLKHGKLEQWQVKRWVKTDRRGTMRIVKYHRQLNEAAKAKAKGA